MASIGDIFGKIGIGGGGGAGGGFMSSMLMMLLGAVGLAGAIGGVYYLLYKRKNWNIKVEFRIPRNIKVLKRRDGTQKVIGNINKEWGKGFYNAKRGVCFIKRKGKKAVPMKPFDIKRFLSTGNILTVIQVGIEDYRPILDDSYIEVVDDKTGEEGALINTRIDTSESKSWKNSFERDSKTAYTIKNWIAEHGALVAMGLVLLMNLIGFAIVIAKMPKA